MHLYNTFSNLIDGCSYKKLLLIGYNSELKNTGNNLLNTPHFKYFCFKIKYVKNKLKNVLKKYPVYPHLLMPILEAIIDKRESVARGINHVQARAHIDQNFNVSHLCPFSVSIGRTLGPF